ncbi:hypothetical protein [uncultured Aquimarina sp.]|uniref:hypothetical protein n=1 Tax=uncultured Aquimarina sp. TaxID=575652 RepID=UPI002621F46A|nr:hypothetical protein [uncultured Aquimarina sp.]
MKFPLGYTINYYIKIPFLLVFYILFSNPVNSQNMEDFIEYDSFVIIEKPQKTYKGIYKEGKPYQGYFSKGNREFPRVDYYENGEAKFQYSLDIYQMTLGVENTEKEGFQEKDGEVMNEEYYEAYTKDLYKPKLNIKSVYENDQIINGYEYEEESSTMFSKKIENYKITELHIDLFAMHYYQRTSMVLVADTILIGSPTLATVGEKLQVRLSRKDNGWVAAYDINGNHIGSKYFVNGEPKSLPINSTLFIYDQNNDIYSYGTSDFIEYPSRLDLIDLLGFYFDKPKTFTSENIQVFFKALVEASIMEMKREEGVRPKEPEIYRGYIITGDNSEVIKGIRFFEKEVDSYYEEYNGSNEVKKEKIDLVSFQEVFKKYLKNIKKD